MKVIINMSGEPDEIMALFREVSGTDIKENVVSEIPSQKKRAGRPKKTVTTEEKDDIDKEIESKIFG
ncbi:hypothetical protein [Megasphaera stantonii]|uniref:Uncharacterized protein n=1 Tax=Megasphaera stantonii TaxID=2144175 RepID=A0A346B142_9FIRM|nr:hypothetical protein [Megasphaera stantonii]AXL21835.1 hypothetical protein DKB62_09815 [Megasphaera stantonii]